MERWSSRPRRTSYLHRHGLFEYEVSAGDCYYDRMDYLNPLGNNLVYVMAAEKLLDLEIPERAQTAGLMCELQRIGLHLVWQYACVDIGA